MAQTTLKGHHVPFIVQSRFNALFLLLQSLSVRVVTVISSVHNKL